MCLPLLFNPVHVWQFGKLQWHPKFWSYPSWLVSESQIPPILLRFKIYLWYIGCIPTKITICIVSYSIVTGWASKCRDIVLISWDFTHVVCYVVRAGTCLYLNLQVGFVFSFLSDLVGSKAINVGTQAIYDAKIKTNELSTLLESCWIQSFPPKKMPPASTISTL